MSSVTAIRAREQVDDSLVEELWNLLGESEQQLDVLADDFLLDWRLELDRQVLALCDLFRLLDDHVVLVLHRLLIRHIDTVYGLLDSSARCLQPPEKLERERANRRAPRLVVGHPRTDGRDGGIARAGVCATSIEREGVSAWPTS